MTRDPITSALIAYTRAEADLVRCTRLMDTRGYAGALRRLRAARRAIMAARCG